MNWNAECAIFFSLAINIIVIFAAIKSVAMNNDIFISYSRKDSKVVDEFVNRLEDEGFRVWIDRDGIESGDAFKRVIVKAIKESSIVAFFSSEHSNTSPWTAKEINIAVHYDKPIIPIKIDKSVYNDEVEFDLVSLDYVDYTDPSMRSAMMEKMVRTIKSRLPERWKEICEAKSGQESQQQPPLVEKPRPSVQESKPVVTASPSSTKGNGRSKKGLWIALGIAAAAVIAFLVLMPMLRSTEQLSQSESQVAYKDMTFTANGVTFVMKPVEGGTFQMGFVEDMGNQDGSVAHPETVGTFYIGETEVTQALWKAVMGTEPTHDGGWTDKCGRGENYPAYQVSWNDIQKFILQLNALTGKSFRLPTEAEWEFAARGGTKTNGYLYAGSNHIGTVAWYNQNSESKNHEVKSMQPNELGLYDMSGNVWEWCSNFFDQDAKDAMRVLRGGGWNRNVDRCQVTFRGSGGPDFRGNSHGFRLAMSL